MENKKDGGTIPDGHVQGQEKVSIKSIIVTATFQKSLR